MKLLILTLLLHPLAAAAQTFSPCPLIGNYFPAPSRKSIVNAQFPAKFEKAFADLVRNSGHPIFGPISANTTSFSVVYFTRESAKNASQSDGPVIFQYHHTSPYDVARNLSAIDADTAMPLAEVSMVLTVYTWLASMGNHWDDSITKYLPDLKGYSSKAFSIPWEDITIGSLAGHLSGLPRVSSRCTIGAACNATELIEGLNAQGPTYLPDSTPIFSYAAFQVLAAAMEKHGGNGPESTFKEIFSKKVLEPLSMKSTWLLDERKSVRGLDMAMHAEQAAMSIVSTANDLALAGQAMLSSKLVSPATTRRWFRRSADTSNLRNGAGLPWEIYRAASSPISPIVDAFTKAGGVGAYGSYFGLVPELDVGFAILARDFSLPQNTILDLNAYVDVASETIPAFGKLGAAAMVGSYAGTFISASSDALVVDAAESGPGLAISKLTIRGKDLKAEVAALYGLAAADLDFRLYPTNVQDGTVRRQFVAVYQSKVDLADAGTPTCITWQDVGTHEGVPYRFVFDMDASGRAISVSTEDGVEYNRP